MKVSAVARQATGMTRDEALERARELASQLRPYVDAAETDRRLPKAAVEAMEASGLLHMVRPSRWGGLEMDWMTLLDCVAEVGQVSGSLGWCFCFLMQHQWVLSYFPEAAQAAVYSRDAAPRIVTSFGAFGRAAPDGGGYRISGDWSFGSGGDHCDWAIVGAPVVGPQPGMRWFLLQPGQFSIRDTWNSVGLKGSGSNNIVVQDALVAEDFSLDLGAAFAGHAPGSQFLDGPLYRAPLSSQFQFGLLSPMMGVARGALETFLEFSQGRVGTMTGSKVAESPLLQVRIGEAAAEIDAAYAVLEKISGGVMSGELATPAVAARVGRDFGFCARLMVQAVDRLFAVAGARGLNEGNALGRHWRDIHAISNHVALNAESLFVAFGREALGLPPAGR
jgi:3-hydroxy-9,10-secoandrosta-1,3,5(10)-triene-9,17-dione monooxygenase